jgi:hypothetical protein
MHGRAFAGINAKDWYRLSDAEIRNILATQSICGHPTCPPDCRADTAGIAIIPCECIVNCEFATVFRDFKGKLCSLTQHLLVQVFFFEVLVSYRLKKDLTCEARTGPQYGCYRSCNG